MSKKNILLLLLCIFIIAVGTAVVVTAEETGGFLIPWWTIDGGGNTSTGGTYILTGTAGQAEAGCSAGGNYSLRSGFWQSCPIYNNYLPLIAR